MGLVQAGRYSLFVHNFNNSVKFLRFSPSRRCHPSLISSFVSVSVFFLSSFRTTLLYQFPRKWYLSFIGFRYAFIVLRLLYQFPSNWCLSFRFPIYFYRSSSLFVRLWSISLRLIPVTTVLVSITISNMAFVSVFVFVRDGLQNSVIGLRLWGILILLFVGEIEGYQRLFLSLQAR